jgi:hypothetical protein
MIFDGATPTSFRARTRDTLVPTFVQLQRTQPSVTLKWFERGRTWESPAEAREAFLAMRARRQQVRRERGPDWRPGGAHRDPRKRYEMSRDQKRARFKARLHGPGPGRPAKPRRPGGPRKPK